MRLEDWRESPPDRLAPLFEQECDRWRRHLGWDAQPLFALVERTRGAGGLPGLIAVDDDGHVAGWCYATLHEGLLFIGALHGERAEVVRALLDAVLATPEASYARGYRCFMFPETPAVTAALVRRRFDVKPFLYLSRPIAGGTDVAVPAPTRGWQPEDLPETVRLMARAYAGTEGGRCFAPGGRLEEWAAYLAQIARTPACGTWLPEASFACPPDAGVAGPGLLAVLIATRLAGETAHVAQVAVDPQWRGRGIAAALVEASAARAAASGATRQTLLVAESNATARRLYARLGFVETTSFVFADRARISRVGTANADPSRISA